MVASLQTEAWATEYPREAANPSALPLQLVRGGRIVKQIPNYTDQLTAISLLEALEADAAWLDPVMQAKTEESELDPNRDAVWETSPEGQEALNRRRKRDRERLQELQRSGTRAAGNDDPAPWLRDGRQVRLAICRGERRSSFSQRGLATAHDHRRRPRRGAT